MFIVVQSSHKMFRRWLTSTLILFIALMANSSAQEASSNSHQDIPVRSETAGAEHHRASNDSYWRPHFHTVQNVQIHGCDGYSETRKAAATDDNVLNMTQAILDILQNLEPRFTSHYPSLYTPAPISRTGHPRDCAEIQDSGISASGVYGIYPDGDGSPFFVSCDMETDGGGWTVFQRRRDGSIDFFLEWADYKYGFGSVSGEHWLGNDNIHRLALQKTYELRVDLEDFEGETRYAQYSTFYVADEDANYVLTLGEYSGDAEDSLSYHSGHPFTTKDRDNDNYSPSNCASASKGAWWYNTCHYSNLNGLYLHGANSEISKGVVWAQWHGRAYSLKKTEMKIRPVEFSEN